MNLARPAGAGLLASAAIACGSSANTTADAGRADGGGKASPDAGSESSLDADRVRDASIGAEPAVVLHYNVGNGAGFAGQDDVVAWLDRGDRPVAITLNELCGARYYEIDDVAGSVGYQGAFFATNPDGCGGSNAGLGYGNAIFVRGEPASEFQRFDYVAQEPEAETRNIGCVVFEPVDRPAMAACVTHLENNETYSADQAHEALNVATALELDITGRVVVGGDFNLDPDHPSMLSWEASAFASGDLRQATHESGRTIDYVFSTGGAPEVAIEDGVSDHRALWATLWAAP